MINTSYKNALTLHKPVLPDVVNLYVNRRRVDSVKTMYNINLSVLKC